MKGKHKGPHVCWFDIPADNTERSKNFYAKLFGWKIEKEAETPMEYFMISSEGSGHSEKHPRFLGGLLKRKHPAHTITVYIDVPSIDSYAEQVKKLGGQIISTKTAVPGWGYFVVCQDTENNNFALWEENKDAR